MKVISNYLIDSYFSNFKALSKFFTKMKKKISFSFLKLYYDTGLKLVKYLILTISPSAFEYIIISFKPKKDYRNDYLKIINFNI